MSVAVVISTLPPTWPVSAHVLMIIVTGLSVSASAASRIARPQPGNLLSIRTAFSGRDITSELPPPSRSTYRLPPGLSVRNLTT